jgi:fatty acid desaturase
MRIFRRSAMDLSIVLCSATYLAVVAFGLTHFASLTLLSKIALGLAIFTLSIVCGYGNHYAAHGPIVASRRLNAVYLVLISLIPGVPSSMYAYQHLIHHDPEFLRRQQIYNTYPRRTSLLMSLGLLRPRRRLLDLLEQCLSVRWLVFFLRHRPLDRAHERVPDSWDSWQRRAGDPTLDEIPTRRFVPSVMVTGWLEMARVRGRRWWVFAECLIIVSAKLALWLYSYLFAIFYNLINVANRMANGYSELNDHYGAEQENREANAASSYGRLWNLLVFNNGYHFEHHYKPGVHWTKVPALRREVNEKLCPERDRRVVPGSLFFNVFHPMAPKIHEASRLVRRAGPTVAVETTDDLLVVSVSEDKFGDVPARIMAAPDTIDLHFDASVAPLATDDLLAEGQHIDVADVLSRHNDLDSEDVLWWFERLTRVGLYERTWSR